MKNILNKFYFLTLVSAALFSCEKDEEQIIATTSTAPNLSATVQNVELSQSSAEEVAVVFNWTAAEVNWSNPDVAPDGAMNYYLQFDQQGEEFSSPVVVDMGTSLEKSYTVDEFNTFLIERMNLEVGTPANLEVRVRAALAPNVEGVFSEAVSLTATPYEEVTTPALETIYMVGDATEFDWDNTKATPMFISGDGTFTYTGHFDAGGFKFLKVRGQWAPMWGADGNGVLVPRPTEADPDPNTISVPTAGYYTITVDTVNLTYTFAEFDASAAPTYESIAIIGEFTNWTDDVPMTKSAYDPHIWTLDYTFAANTPMKFRKAGDWGVNWGPATDAERDMLWGQGVQDGKDINMVAGTYTIYFNDLTGRYMFIRK